MMDEKFPAQVRLRRSQGYLCKQVRPANSLKRAAAFCALCRKPNKENNENISGRMLPEQTV
jgi:hypothetical protein